MSGAACYLLAQGPENQYLAQTVAFFISTWD
jgi:hypothetical protein